MDIGGESSQMSRRAFLGGVFAAGTALAIGLGAGEAQAAQDTAGQGIPDTQPDQDPSIVTDFPEWYAEFVNPKQSYLTSGKQEIAASLAALGLGLPLKAVGIPVGNASIRELLDDPERLRRLSTRKFMFNTILKAPVKEELLFRALPSAALNFGRSSISKSYDTSSPELGAGFVTAVGFALFHNRNTEQGAVPLPQFMSGMVGWRLARKAGIRHAVGGHFVHNVAAIGLMSPMYYMRRREALKAAPPAAE